MISCAVMSVRIAALYDDDVELAVVASTNFIRLIDARLHAESFEEHVLGARVARVDAVGVRAGVPLVDRRVELHARVAADVRALGDQPHQVARLVGVHHLRRSLTACVSHVPSSSTARMNSSVTRTLLFEFWKNTDEYAGPVNEPS